MWLTPAPNPATPHPWTARTSRPARRPADVLSLVATLLVALLVLTLLPASAGAATPGPVGDVIPDRLLVKFDDGAPAKARIEARREAGAEYLSSVEQLGVQVWRIPEHAAARALRGLQRNPHVAYAELDAVVELDAVATHEPNDPEWYRQWGPRQVNAPAAWAVTTSTSSATIAILDTGVSTEHPDLRDKLLPGRNTIDGSTNVTDTHSHGTASAGVAGAATDNGLDVAGYGWDASILPVKVIDGHGGGSMSALAAGIVWATDRGADVVSMSLGGTSGTTTVRDAVRYASDRGVVLVASAGNDGNTTQRYPAAYPEVIAVAGTDATDQLYSWSNHGSWVDVAAPGQNRTTRLAGGSILYAGTSSAAPAVAGVLALGTPYASGAELRAALQASAAPLPFVRYGRIDAHAMLVALGAGSSGPAPAPEPEPAPAPDPEGPTAAFTATCDLLSCRFVDQSTLGDAALASWAWTFGDGTAGKGATTEHEYAGAGSYTVRLTVTDGNGLRSSASRVVTVDAPSKTSAPAPAIDLRASGSKSKGTLTADLAWSGSAAAKVDVHVDGVRTATITNGGSYAHRPKAKGNPAITYRICDAGSTVACSAEVTVTSW